jgi:hypothetical protein
MRSMRLQPRSLSLQPKLNLYLPLGTQSLQPINLNVALNNLYRQPTNLNLGLVNLSLQPINLNPKLIHPNQQRIHQITLKFDHHHHPRTSSTPKALLHPLLLHLRRPLL